ncbi:hypothetical protein J6590_103524, partial [Homalodisca vitripennis]
RKKLDAIYEGPYKIIAVISDVSFVVQDLRDANIYKRVHSMNMKLGTKLLLSVDQVKEMSELAEAPQYYFGSDCRLSVGPHKQRTEIRLLTALNQ